MTLHLAIVVIHVISSAILFAAGIVTAMVMVVACGMGDEAGIAWATRRVVCSDWCLTVPSGILQPLSGIWLAVDGGYGVTSSWLVLSYGLYGLAALCWFPVAALQVRMADLAEQAHISGVPLAPAFWQAFWWWFALGWPAFGALLTMIWLMVVKPVLW